MWPWFIRSARTMLTLAAELPALYRTLSVRRRVEALPLLDASVDRLHDSELLRAASLLSIVSHAYWYVDGRTPSALPEVLRRPWAQVRARLGRGGPVARGAAAPAGVGGQEPSHEWVASRCPCGARRRPVAALHRDAV